MKNILFAAACLLFLHTHAQNSSVGFSGSNQYISVPDQNGIDLIANFTIEGWINPAGIGSDIVQGGIIINKENSYEIARFADGSLQYALSANGAGTDWAWVNTGLVVPLNTWTHFAMIKSGTTITFYLNGAASYSNAAGPATLTANTQLLYMGSRFNGGQFFNGTMDEIRIWNTARTLAEIKAAMFNRNLANTSSGMVAYYRMNEGSGTSTVNSCTNTSGINGTLVNTPAWAASPVQYSANALSFDGINDAVTVPYNSSLDITSAITLEAWVYATKNSGIQNVVSKSSSLLNTGYIFPRTDDGWDHVVSYLFIGGGWKNLSATYPSLNAWHHLALTYDGATMKMYIDGVLASSQAQTGAIATNTNPLALGNQTGFLEYFGGSADEIRVWNTARTQAQLQAGMNAELNPALQTGLVSNYTFNQGLAAGANPAMATIFDIKGSNNGSLGNFAMNGSGSNFVTQKSGLFLLPVSGFNFTAKRQAADIVLNWSTTIEQHSLNFIVQHSADASSWINLATLPAAGNSSSLQQYSFTHRNPASGNNYYRIAQLDIDGQLAYSKTINLLNSAAGVQLQVYPNPVTNSVLHLQLKEAAAVSIYNSAGLMVMHKQLPAGTQSLDLRQLARGVYQLKAGPETTQVLVQ